MSSAALIPALSAPESGRAGPSAASTHNDARKAPHTQQTRGTR